MRFAKRIILWAIRFYQGLVSPAFPPSCRFVPSCSEYAYRAVEKYGVFRGLWLGLGRLLRCHPLCSGGWDPVP